MHVVFHFRAELDGQTHAGRAHTERVLAALAKTAEGASGDLRLGDAGWLERARNRFRLSDGGRDARSLDWLLSYAVWNRLRFDNADAANSNIWCVAFGAVALADAERMDALLADAPGYMGSAGYTEMPPFYSLSVLGQVDGKAVTFANEEAAAALRGRAHDG